MKTSKKRTKIKLNQKYAELSYLSSVFEDTKDLFYAYDLELTDFLNQLDEVLDEVEDSKAEESDLEESLIKKSEAPQERFENAQKEPSKENSFEDLENEIVNNFAPPWMKKAFKAIALKTHPDKVLFRDDLSDIEKNSMVEKYTEAAKAMASSSGISLLEIAQSLDIELDLSPREQISMLENKIKKVQNQIKDYNSMVSWSWGENEGNLGVRANLIVFVRNHLSKSPLSAEFLKGSIKKFESGIGLFEKSKNRNKILKRPVGTRPHPRISTLRKK